MKREEEKAIRVVTDPYYHIRKLLFSFPYPKLALLALSIVAAYQLFTFPSIRAFISALGDFGYFGMFVAGLLFSFGFTAPFAIGLLMTLNPPNIFLAALIGGSGALLSDLCIYNLIKFSFMNEFKRLQRTAPVRIAAGAMEHTLSGKIRAYLLYALAGFIIASPLPDEIGVSMLAGLTTIRARTLALLSFVMNMLGIFVILWASSFS